MPDEPVGGADNQGSAGSTGASGSDAGGQQSAGGGLMGLITDTTLHGEKSLQNIKDVNALAKGYVEAQKMVGGSIRMPKPEASKEEWDAFHEKMGRPKKPEDYQIKRPAMHPHASYDEGMEAEFKQVAHKIGLTPRQAQELIDWQAGTVNQRTEGSIQKLDQTVQELRKEWGSNFERNVTLSRRAVQDFAGPEVAKILDSTGLGNHPAVIRFFSELGSILAEDGIIEGNVAGVMGPEEAQKKIAEIMNNPEDLYHAKHAQKPGHAERVKEIEGLFQIAYRGK